MKKFTEKKLCAFGCGVIVHEGRRLCKHHLEQQKIKMAGYRVNRKKLGLCSRCPNTARLKSDGKPSTLCDPCRKHVRELETKQGAEA